MTLEFTPMEPGYITVAIEGDDNTVRDAVDCIISTDGHELLSSVSYTPVFDLTDDVTRATFLLKSCGN